MGLPGVEGLRGGSGQRFRAPGFCVSGFEGLSVGLRTSPLRPRKPEPELLEIPRGKAVTMCFGAIHGSAAPSYAEGLLARILSATPKLPTPSTLNPSP